MERSMADVRAYAASLVQCLQHWDPLSTDASAPHVQQQKQDFVDALTEISALTSEALDMEVRRLIVDAHDDDDVYTDSNETSQQPADRHNLHLLHLMAALSHRDVLLKCKVANAVGSLCTSRVAGQRLLELHGDALVASLGRMATSKNTWAQADAFFVFGWIVVVGEDALVQQHLLRFIATAIKLLGRNLQHKTDESLEEQDANLRIYCLVFLLNFSQREVVALEAQLMPLLEMLQLMLTRLLEETTVLLDSETDQDDREMLRENVSEHMEFVRLTVTLLNGVVDQVDEAPATIITLKMLPQVLKLEQTLYRKELEVVLHADDSEDEVDSGELDELRERMRCIKETILAHR